MCQVRQFAIVVVEFARQTTSAVFCW